MIIHMYCSTGCAVVIESCSRIQLRSHPSHHLGLEPLCQSFCQVPCLRGQVAGVRVHDQVQGEEGRGREGPEPPEEDVLDHLQADGRRPHRRTLRQGPGQFKACADRNETASFTSSKWRPSIALHCLPLHWKVSLVYTLLANIITCTCNTCPYTPLYQ